MPDNEEIRKEKMRKKRRAERRRKERQRALVARAVTLALLLVVLVAIIVVAIRISRKDTVPQDTVTDTVVTQAATPDTQNAQQNTQNTQSTAETTAIPEQPQQTAEVPQPVVTVPTTKEEALNLARFQAMQYDYDKAIATIQAFGGYESDADLVNEINSITAQRDSCTAVDVSRTPHVFFHSLINDSRGLIASATCCAVNEVSRPSLCAVLVRESNWSPVEDVTAWTRRILSSNPANDFSASANGSDNAPPSAIMSRPSPWQDFPNAFSWDCAESRLFLSFDVSAVTST